MEMIPGRIIPSYFIFIRARIEIDESATPAFHELERLVLSIVVSAFYSKDELRVIGTTQVACHIFHLEIQNRIIFKP